MGLFLFGLLLMATFGGDSNGNKKHKKQKKTYRRRVRRSDYTDGLAWFHDHGQRI